MKKQKLVFFLLLLFPLSFIQKMQLGLCIGDADVTFNFHLGTDCGSPHSHLLFPQNLSTHKETLGPFNNSGPSSFSPVL